MNHPIDFEALEKGDVIDRETIETAYNIRHDKDPLGYRMKAQLRLRDEIHRCRPDLHARTRQDALVILTDAELEAYTVERHVGLVRATMRNARDRGKIDRSGFSEAQKKKAESYDMLVTGTAFAARKALAKERRTQLMLTRGDKD